MNSTRLHRKCRVAIPGRALAEGAEFVGGGLGAEWLVAVVKVSLVFLKLKLLRSMNLWGQDLSPYWLMLIRFLHAVKRRVAVGREVS